MFNLVSRKTTNIDTTALHPSVAADESIYNPNCRTQGCPQGSNPFYNFDEGTYPGHSKAPTPWWVWILVWVGSAVVVAVLLFILICCCYRTQSCCWDPASGFECCPGWHRPCPGCCKKCNMKWCTLKKPQKEKKKEPPPKYGGAQGGTLNPDAPTKNNNDYNSQNHNPYQNGYGEEQPGMSGPPPHPTTNTAMGGGYFY